MSTKIIKIICEIFKLTDAKGRASAAKSEILSNVCLSPPRTFCQSYLSTAKFKSDSFDKSPEK